MSIIRGINRRSRLYPYLKAIGFRKALRPGGRPRLQVARLGGSHDVYLVKDAKSQKKFILKYFGFPHMPDAKSARHMDKEYRSLKKANHIINGRQWVHVVRPLCKSDSGDFFLEQFVSGKPLSDYMREAVMHGKDGPLYEKLTMLAGFFGLLHKKTRRPSRVKINTIGKELKKHARQASAGGAFTPDELKDMERLIDKACSYGFIKGARKSLVHGDANPTNFLYNGGRLYVIDMERAGYRDPVYDLGMIAGELFHFAMRYGGDPYKADPFIGHLYWLYAGNYKDQLGTFIRLTKRNPLYMANSLLRIARHPNFSKEYKRRLAYHAKECLKSLEKF